MSNRRISVDEVSEPADIAGFRSQDERARRNSEWLRSHWADLLSRVRGRFLAVAGQEAFVADSPEEAQALASAAHPEDDGVLVQYVRAERGPRLCACSTISTRSSAVARCCCYLRITATK